MAKLSTHEWNVLQPKCNADYMALPASDRETFERVVSTLMDKGYNRKMIMYAASEAWKAENAPAEAPAPVAPARKTVLEANRKVIEKHGRKPAQSEETDGNLTPAKVDAIAERAVAVDATALAVKAITADLIAKKLTPAEYGKAILALQK